MPQGGPGKSSKRKDLSLGMWDGPGLQNQLLIDLQAPGVPNPSDFFVGWILSRVPTIKE